MDKICSGIIVQCNTTIPNYRLKTFPVLLLKKRSYTHLVVAVGHYFDKLQHFEFKEIFGKKFTLNQPEFPLSRGFVPPHRLYVLIQHSPIPCDAASKQSPYFKRLWSPGIDSKE
jgi:hypothetical protein